MRRDILRKLMRCVTPRGYSLEETNAIIDVMESAVEAIQFTLEQDHPEIYGDDAKCAEFFVMTTRHYRRIMSGRRVPLADLVAMHTRLDLTVAWVVSDREGAMT